jgi:hypothetical protein
LNNYPLTDDEQRRAWARLREANNALRAALSLSPLEPETLARVMRPSEQHAQHFDPDCDECSWLAGTVRDKEPQAELAAARERVFGGNLPIRVVVDQHGHYWRDYGDHWSMCPVSEENRSTEPVAEFYLAADVVLDDQWQHAVVEMARLVSQWADAIGSGPIEELNAELCELREMFG